MALNLDEKDIQILMWLQQNSRISLTELSDILHMPVADIHERMKKLDVDDYLKGYATVLSRSKTDKKLLFIAGIRLYSNKDEHVWAFKKEIADIPQIVNSYRVNGCFDFLFHVLLSDMYDFHRNVASRLMDMENVVSMRSFYIPNEAHGVQRDPLNDIFKSNKTDNGLVN
ncbi:Lrp/AsnC family leucine-responsive transcriptional regulator [Pedobacter africanus]|uniref:DNA-binding Lrp family transcriptional regulator n=1 Tax=Pedobacter africanus TaxID=151894 RepID=A0ACC6KR52_9SPHI|nr:Lrp/AsnC family transcriptional regulator [Pedobacter africanus]MDR6781612.1 DNA-binding Lrp family transcriptional regulator [Pedobacter africanus]